MRIADMSWMQVEAYLESDDLAVLPVGSTEQHGYLSLATDWILAERVAVEAAEPLGVPVFPPLPYGLTPYFMAYPGTVSLTPDSYRAVLGDILAALRRTGFRRIAVVNGHGGNSTVGRAAAGAWAAQHADTRVLWHDWWRAPATMAAVRAIDADASHASWMEGFPWTRVPGVTPPEGHKAPVDLTDRETLSPEAFRARIGDGSFGGDYRRPDDDVLHIWSVAIEETRDYLEHGWQGAVR